MNNKSKRSLYKITPSELHDKLEMKHDGGAWRGTCPSCSCKHAFLYTASERNAGKILWFCTEGCSDYRIAASVDRALRNGLPGNFGRPRPYDAAQAATAARCEQLLTQHIAKVEAVKKAIADEQSKSSPPTSHNKH